MTFTRGDLDVVTSSVVEAWAEGLDRDWSVPAGTVEWSCTRTAEHAADAVIAVGVFLASRRQDSYPPWWPEVRFGEAVAPPDLVEAIGAAGRVLSGVIAAAEPGARAVIWRRPTVMTGTPDDFAARGALEMILHAHDVCAGLGVPFAPPTAEVRRLRDHTRPWPHWSAPGWSVPPTTDDPWSDLLRGSGRT